MSAAENEIFADIMGRLEAGDNLSIMPTNGGYLAGVLRFGGMGITSGDCPTLYGALLILLDELKGR